MATPPKKPRSDDKTDGQSPDEAGGVAEDAVKSTTGQIEAALVRELEELEDLVREHPLATVGIAASLGLVAGLILSRR